MLFKRIVCFLPLVMGVAATAYAAEPVTIKQLSPLAVHQFSLDASGGKLEEVSRAQDFNQTTHVRVKQTYKGYRVWGGEAVLHMVRGQSVAASMDGQIYTKLAADLSPPPSPSRGDMAVFHAVKLYEAATGQMLTGEQPQRETLVYLDKNKKAHWAYLIRFAATMTTEMTPTRPTYILDANTFKVYEHWDDVKTLEEVAGGGVGGNEKQGQLIFDGYDGHLAALTVTREAATNQCYLDNSFFTVLDHRRDNQLMSYACAAKDVTHNHVYWNNESDEINSSYSPGFDALYGAKVVLNMYRDWYNMPPLTVDGKPMKLSIIVHHPMANASWDDNRVTLGDSVDENKPGYYPFTSLGVVGHEIGHGVTRQHSDLVYENQSGGLNEAFSDMSAQAVEYYAYGHNSWLIGPEILKDKHKSLRYMDQPSKDCYGKQPGDHCSIDHVSQYVDGMNVHKSSGIFNRVFYLIGTAEGWNTHRAFDVMLQANLYYWTAHSTFAEAACGTIKATRDYRYDLKAVVSAFQTVGIDVTHC